MKSPPRERGRTSLFSCRLPAGLPAIVLLCVFCFGSIAAAQDQLQISGSSFNSGGVLGGPYTPSSNVYTLVNTGMTSLTWTVSSYPFFVTLSATNGTLAAGGTDTVTAAIDSDPVSGSGIYSGSILFYGWNTAAIQNEPVTLTVVAAPPAVTSATFTGTAGSAFSYNIIATNYPASYGASGLPPGLSVNTATGLISGTYAMASSNQATITASNAFGTGTGTLAFTVQAGPVPIPVITVGAPSSMVALDYFAPESYVGSNPEGTLVLGPGGPGGYLYGTTSSSGESGGGSIFELELEKGSEPTPYFEFPVSYGGAPVDGPLLASNGTFYVTASADGVSNCGAILSIPTSGFVGWWPFGPAYTSGSVPLGGVISGTDGNFYGTTSQGGTYGKGTFYKLNPSPYVGGGISTLNSFTTASGAYPRGELLQAANGNFYGTTSTGGQFGFGTIFEYSGAGNIAALVSFTGRNQPYFGANPYAGLTQGADGSLYGTTLAGGTNEYEFGGQSTGTVFKVSTGGVFTSLYSFTGTIDGMAPRGRLIQAADGNFYGTTSATGTGVGGSIFRITPAGSLQVMFTFGSAYNPEYGAGPYAGLAQGADSCFYGTTYQSGEGGGGTVFKITPPLINATAGEAFSYPVSASNSPTNFSATGLPPGLTINPSTGVISGAPTASGTFNAILSASNAGGTGGLLAMFNVLAPPPPAITSGSIAFGPVHGPFDYQIAATNSPTGYSASGLPTGLSLNSATGLISGTVTSTGTTATTIGAINFSGTGSASLSIVILQPYAAWQNTWFTPAQLLDPTVSSDTASPAGDGIPNLLKYALNLNPNAPSTAEPEGSIMAIRGFNYLTLSYTQVPWATDITYTPEVSADLQNWYSGPGYTATVSVTTNVDGVTQTVVVQDLAPIGASAGQYMQLRVTGP